MKYITSSASAEIDKSIIHEFKKPVIKFLKENFCFRTKEFEEFLIIFNYFHAKYMEDLGIDKIKISKKENSICLVVKIYNEVILDDKLTFEEKLNYHFERINEVKALFHDRLKKVGLIDNIS